MERARWSQRFVPADGELTTIRPFHFSMPPVLPRGCIFVSTTTLLILESSIPEAENEQGILQCAVAKS